MVFFQKKSKKRWYRRCFCHHPQAKVILFISFSFAYHLLGLFLVFFFCGDPGLLEWLEMTRDAQSVPTWFSCLFFALWGLLVAWAAWDDERCTICAHLILLIVLCFMGIAWLLAFLLFNDNDGVVSPYHFQQPTATQSGSTTNLPFEQTFKSPSWFQCCSSQPTCPTSTTSWCRHYACEERLSCRYGSLQLWLLGFCWWCHWEIALFCLFHPPPFTWFWDLSKIQSSASVRIDFDPWLLLVLEATRKKRLKPMPPLLLVLTFSLFLTLSLLAQTHLTRSVWGCHVDVITPTPLVTQRQLVWSRRRDHSIQTWCLWPRAKDVACIFFGLGPETPLADSSEDSFVFKFTSPQNLHIISNHKNNDISGAWTPF